MAIVAKWCQDGEYIAGAHADMGVSGVEWTERQSDAMRFTSQAAFRLWVRHVGLLPKNLAPGWWERLRFVRLVPRKRHASSQP